MLSAPCFQRLSHSLLTNHYRILLFLGYSLRKQPPLRCSISIFPVLSCHCSHSPSPFSITVIESGTPHSISLRAGAISFRRLCRWYSVGCALAGGGLFSGSRYLVSVTEATISLRHCSLPYLRSGLSFLVLACGSSGSESTVSPCFSASQRPGV